jgi:6-phosphogluconolactonase
MTDRTFAFVGSVNRGMDGGRPARGGGIDTYAFDEATGALSPLARFADIDNPTFLALDAGRRRLYAAVEWGDRNEGLAVALEIDPQTGALSYINMQPTLGSTTCHVSLDTTGGLLFATSYTLAPVGARPGQAMAALPIRDDGGLLPAIASVAHHGPGAVLPASASSHAHCAIPSPDGRHVLVTDLGLDCVTSYRLPPAGGTFAVAAPRLALPKGAGPRHLVFDASGTRAYLINEHGCTIVALAYDPETGRLTSRQSVPALPPGTSVHNQCAEIVLSPDGRHLYGTNRGHDSIVRFAVDADGLLSEPQWTPTGGSWPRNLTFDPSGRFVLVVNQYGDSIVVFRHDAATGGLAPVGKPVAAGSPMRMVFGRFG